VLQRQIRIHAFELGVFRLKLTQALQLRHLHARVLALPLVVRGVADAVLAAQLGDRDSGFAFFEHRNDLAFGKSAFLQGSLRLKGGSEILLADVYSEGELTLRTAAAVTSPCLSHARFCR